MSQTTIQTYREIGLVYLDSNGCNTNFLPVAHARDSPIPSEQGYLSLLSLLYHISILQPSSFINSIFSWTTASTLGRNTPALPSAQQSVAHSAGSPIYSSQVDFNGTAMLGYLMFKKFTGEECLEPLNNPLFYKRRNYRKRA